MPKKPIQTTREHQPSPIPEMQRPGARTDDMDATSPNEITELILKDHLPLKELIQVLKDPEVLRSSKEVQLEEFVTLLTSHAKAEEKTLYVEMKNYPSLRAKSYEGDTGHAIADQLVQEINGTPDDDEWLAKVKLLAELVENHIDEEENEIIPAVHAEIEFQTRMEIGTAYTEFKQNFDRLLVSPADTRRQQIIEGHAH